MSVFALLLHHQMQYAIGSWEQRQVAALGHHLAEMLSATPPDDRAASLERLAAPLAQFGISARLSSPRATPVEGVQVPLVGGPPLELRSTAGGHELATRLAPLYLGLTGGVLATLLLAVQASTYWSLRRPLRGVGKQISQMRRGRWWVPAKAGGVAEVALLSSSLESLGKELESEVSQWVEAERRAGFELARNRLRLATLELRREIRFRVAELAAGEEQTGASHRALFLASEQLLTELERPLEELGLGPPEWSELTEPFTKDHLGVEDEAESG